MEGLDFTHCVFGPTGAASFFTFADDAAAVDYAARHAYVTAIQTVAGKLVYGKVPENRWGSVGPK